MSITRHPLAAETRHLRQVPVDQTTIARLEKSFEHMVRDPDALAESFYRLLFARHPQLRKLFPANLDQQKRKLREALATVVATLREPARAQTALKQLGARHLGPDGYGVKPEHFPPVCACLLEATRQSSGDQWSANLDQEWSLALNLVSELMLAGAREATAPMAAR